MGTLAIRLKRLEQRLPRPLPPPRRPPLDEAARIGRAARVLQVLHEVGVFDRLYAVLDDPAALAAYLASVPPQQAARLRVVAEALRAQAAGDDSRPPS